MNLYPNILNYNNLKNKARNNMRLAQQSIDKIFMILAGLSSGLDFTYGIRKTK